LRAHIGTNLSLTERGQTEQRLVVVHASLLSAPTTHDLVQLARAGDVQAIDELLGRLADELLPLASALAAGTTDADALLGDTLSRVYERLHQLQRADALLAWARRLMVRQFLDRRRWRERRREVELQTAEHPVSTVPSAEVLDLRRELADLASADRALVVLRYWQGYTYDECAVLLELPVGTVKSRLSRLLARLRISLGGDQ
jgi:RNA polymerase sigma-70 factor (ECF subfamily)